MPELQLTEQEAAEVLNAAQKLKGDIELTEEEQNAALTLALSSFKEAAEEEEAEAEKPSEEKSPGKEGTEKKSTGYEGTDKKSSGYEGTKEGEPKK